MALPAELDFVKDPEASPARMNTAMAAIDARLRALELPAKTMDDVLATIQQTGLVRINNALQPYYQGLADLVAKYTALTAAPVVEGGSIDAVQTRIKLRRSTTAGDAPTDLQPGELAINQTDKLLFWLDQLSVIHATPLLSNPAPLDSPALTGTPRVPTAALGDNSTLIANTAFVAAATAAAIAALVNSAPSTLDTLKELADALGDDANYAATTATALGLRLRVDAAQGLSALQKHVARLNASAAPWEALAYLNMAINPRIRFSQWNLTTAITVDGTSSAANVYLCDGFEVQANGPKVSAQVAASPFTTRPDLVNAIKVSITTAVASPTASSVLTVYQPVEGQHIARLLFGSSNALKCFVGIMLRTSVAGTYYVTLRNSASGVPNRTCVRKVTLAANTDTFVPLLFPGDTAGAWATDNTIGMLVTVTLMAGSTYQTATSNEGVWQAGNLYSCTDQTNFAATAGATFYLSDLIVLPASTTITDPTQVIPSDRLPLFQRQWEDELRLCERYYQIQYVFIMFPTTSTGSGGTSWTLHTKMRTAPTVSGYSGNAGANFAAAYQSTWDCFYASGTTYTGNAYLYGNYALDARL